MYKEAYDKIQYISLEGYYFRSATAAQEAIAANPKYFEQDVKNFVRFNSQGLQKKNIEKYEWFDDPSLPYNWKMRTVDAVLVFVESSGRLDHIMANIQTLFLAQKFIDKAVLLISSCNITWLLSPGSHQIKVNDLIDHASHCGLIPMDGQVIATSKGLKWDIDGELKFGDVVSTSNGFLSDVITVSCDKPLLWTMDWNGDGVLL